MDAPRSKLPTYCWYALAMACLLAVYVLSIGPAFWLIDRLDADPKLAAVIYRPILWAWVYGPESVGSSIKWYLEVGSMGCWETDRNTIMPYIIRPLLQIDPFI